MVVNRQSLPHRIGARAPSPFGSWPVGREVSGDPKKMDYYT